MRSVQRAQGFACPSLFFKILDFKHCSISTGNRHGRGGDANELIHFQIIEVRAPSADTKDVVDSRLTEQAGTPRDVPVFSTFPVTFVPPQCPQSSPSYPCRAGQQIKQAGSRSPGVPRSQGLLSPAEPAAPPPEFTIHPSFFLLSLTARWERLSGFPLYFFTF